MQSLAIEMGAALRKTDRHAVTLVVDRTDASKEAQRLLDDAKVEYVLMRGDRDPDGILTELPAVFVPATVDSRGELFRGLDRIRALFLARVASP